MRHILLHICRALTVALTLSSSPALLAGELPQAASVEIQQLLSTLVKSGCQFERNGRLYDGANARQHLERKLAYLQDHQRIQSAEDFIRDGASTSSSSGKPYQVICQGKPAMSSQAWLLAALAKQRASQQ